MIGRPVDRIRNKTVVTVISRVPERPAAKEACLVVIYGVELGKKYNLDVPTIIIGRSSKSDIQIDQESVSRNHAKIVNTGKSILIRDLGSTNGTYGHLAGDYVLKHLASVVKAKIRREDIMARFGGEEFAIVLPEIDNFNALQFAEKIRKLVAATKFRFEDADIDVKISVGVA